MLTQMNSNEDSNHNLNTLSCMYMYMLKVSCMYMLKVSCMYTQKASHVKRVLGKQTKEFENMNCLFTSYLTTTLRLAKLGIPVLKAHVLVFSCR